MNWAGYGSNISSSCRRRARRFCTTCGYWMMMTRHPGVPPGHPNSLPFESEDPILSREQRLPPRQSVRRSLCFPFLFFFQRFFLPVSMYGILVYWISTYRLPHLCTDNDMREGGWGLGDGRARARERECGHRPRENTAGRKRGPSGLSLSLPSWIRLRDAPQGRALYN
jgi:hypothetical protein